MNLYQIRDEKSGHFKQPVCHNVDIDALRAVHQVSLQKDANNPLACYPQDFRLYKTGTLDLKTGRIEQLENFIDFGTLVEIAQSFSN